MTQAQTHPDLEAFTRHWLEAEQTVQAYVRVSVRNYSDAAEVVQDAALRMARSYATFDPTRPFLPWALHIARSSIIDHYRRVGRRQPVLSSEVLGELAETAARLDPEIRAMRDRVEHCIEKLPDRWAAIVRLRYAHDNSPMHIAATMGTTPEAIRSALVRIRRSLADCLSRDQASPHPVMSGGVG